jgi:c-di-GMP-binding flagellar brake protein YcgR
MQWGIRYQRVEEDRREYERLPMNFPVSFEGDDVHGAGSVVDISISGCSLHAEIQLEEGKILKMVLQISPDLMPVEVEAAIVRTAHGNRVGIEFLRFEPTERERLQVFLRGLVLGRKTY